MSSRLFSLAALAGDDGAPYQPDSSHMCIEYRRVRESL